MVNIEDYAPIVGKGEIESIKELAEHVKGAKVLHINATKFGGGVAEILNRVVPLAISVGLKAEWKTIHGEKDFFLVTKKIHNALQGDESGFFQGSNLATCPTIGLSGSTPYLSNTFWISVGLNCIFFAAKGSIVG